MPKHKPEVAASFHGRQIRPVIRALLFDAAGTLIAPAEPVEYLVLEIALEADRAVTITGAG